MKKRIVKTLLLVVFCSFAFSNVYSEEKQDLFLNPIQFPHSTEFFDQWELGYEDHRQNVHLLEYVKKGQNVHNWEELITWNYYPYHPIMGSLSDLRDRFIEKLQMNLSPSKVQWKKEDVNSDTLLLEWWIDPPARNAQHEWTSFHKVGKKIFIFHYVYRGQKNKPQEADLWIEGIQKVKVGEEKKAETKDLKGYEKVANSSSWQLFVHPMQKYQIEYPKSWECQALENKEQKKYCTLFQGGENATVAVTLLPKPSDISAEDFIRDSVGAFSKEKVVEIKEMSHQGDLRKYTLIKFQPDFIPSSFQDLSKESSKKGIEEKVTRWIAFRVYKDQVMTVVVLTSEKAFPQYEKTFTEMIESFRFPGEEN